MNNSESIQTIAIKFIQFHYIFGLGFGLCRCDTCLWQKMNIYDFQVGISYCIAYYCRYWIIKRAPLFSLFILHKVKGSIQFIEYSHKTNNVKIIIEIK